MAPLIRSVWSDGGELLHLASEWYAAIREGRLGDARRIRHKINHLKNCISNRFNLTT